MPNELGLPPVSALKPYSQPWYDRLRHALGESACKQLGYYVIPAEFVLSVVVPVYNEEATVSELVQRIADVPLRKEIVLVDDCSADRSRDALLGLRTRFENDPDNRVVVAFHDKNRGKGAALRTGFSKTSGDVVIVQDADLEYDPGEYPRLLQPIIEGQCDVVFGSRFLG